MKNDELKLTAEKLIMDESPLSPEKELACKTVIQMPEEKPAGTGQELDGYKKLVCRQKSEKTEIVLSGAGQLILFSETEENADRDARSYDKEVMVVGHMRAENLPKRAPCGQSAAYQQRSRQGR